MLNVQDTKSTIFYDPNTKLMVDNVSSLEKKASNRAYEYHRISIRSMYDLNYLLLRDDASDFPYSFILYKNRYYDTYDILRKDFSKAFPNIPRDAWRFAVVGDKVVATLFHEEDQLMMRLSYGI